MKYFRSSFVVFLLAMPLAFWIGFVYSGTAEGGLKASFLVLVLSILEISISFDNAIVNAKILQDMSPIWQRRFLTWGMLIAVFGMRVIFPLVIVSIAGQVSPWTALMLASFEPQKYADLMLTAHLPVTAFGGAFLFMLALKYFFDTNKDVHWLSHIEAPLTHLGKMEAIESALTLLVIYCTSKYLPAANQLTFVTAGIIGIITYILVDGIGAFLEDSEVITEHSHEPGPAHKATGGPAKLTKQAAKSGFALFMYLEVLDASFSFDGVVGAFAISNNLFLIAIGLGVGAMFVRSLTLYFVDKRTLTEFRYLEHGAFYAIWILAMIMFTDSLLHISETITGVIGAALIALAFVSSLRYKKKTSN